MASVLLEYTEQKDSKKFSKKILPSGMAKTKRTSTGYSSSGFAQEPHHVVETMGESEGLGSSGGFDTEMTASEVSCAPRKKSISLNADNSGAFGVQMQVISLSKLPRSERKELKLRLKMELDRVRVLLKKVPLPSTNGVALSSSSNIHSFNGGQKRFQADKLQKSLELSSAQGKKHGPPPTENDVPCSKRGTLGRFESAKQCTPSASHTILMKQCEALLKRVMSHQFGWVFNTPVDVVKLNIPDYFNVIKHPMDLGTVQKKMASGLYTSPLGFVADVRLTFSNAMTYNPPRNDVHIMADTLSKYFEVRWKSVEKKLAIIDSGSVAPVPIPARSSVPVKAVDAKAKPPAKKRKISSTVPEVKTLPVKRTMTDEEKHNLSRDIESLHTELPIHIIDFLRNHSHSENQTAEDEIEIDIDALGDETLITLRKLVDDHLREKHVTPEKREHCEMEVLNESGVSNLSNQPRKGNDLVDEDVDIGGNDPPVSSYPPVEIEKDTLHKNGKCSSSSSSSSDSGSSSSDSDSGSSSASETDGAKILSPMSKKKEAVGSGQALGEPHNDLTYNHDGNPSVSGLDQLEQASQPKPPSVDACSSQDGESALSERQVSPGKLYRAALLKNRFADTILKAREKTLGQGEKLDPEKLRREKDELERLKREEKARLQAEAKAAEDARRKAEAEAAAEAKRRRELEREAAREALQKMEKTVEINENCRFLKDLEMLRAPAAEHLPSSVDETSPDHSEDIMGSFKFQGSINPLEQLGLYMKVDDEEEEEAQPYTTPELEPEPVNDVEEGEID